MANNGDNLQTFAERLEKGVADIIARESQRTAARIRTLTPAGRAKTRRGIYSKARGPRGTVGIRFDQHYPGNTSTLRRFRNQWRQLRPIVRQRIVSQINALLKGS